MKKKNYNFKEPQETTKNKKKNIYEGENVKDINMYVPSHIHKQVYSVVLLVVGISAVLITFHSNFYRAPEHFRKLKFLCKRRQHFQH